VGHRITSIFRYFFRRESVETDLDRELRYHLDRQTELNERMGMSREDARRRAALAVGGVEPLKDECRDARLGRHFERVLQDLRYVVRVLIKDPGYSLSAILTLALGIGATTAIFSLVYGIFLRPLPYRDGGQLVVFHQQAGPNRADTQFSPIEIDAYCTRNHTMQDVVEHHSMSFLLLGKDTAERVETSVVSVNFFDVLGVKPLLGRTFVRDQDRPGSPSILILSYKYWQGHFRGDPAIVGRVFQMNDKPHTVIGVLPPVPQYPVESDVYMPTWQCPSRASTAAATNPQFRLISALFGRLKPGATPAQAQADMGIVAKQLIGEHPQAYPKDGSFGISAAALQEQLTHQARTPLMVLLGVAGFVLLIACANVANMMLARLLKLEKELSVRVALGAGKARIIQQLLTESVLVALSGGVLGLLLAPLALEVLSGFAAKFTTRAAEVRIDAPIQIFALLLSLATGLLFGLAPAFSPWHTVEGLHQGGRTTGSRGRQALRSALVIAQVAVSFVLLIGAGLMVRSFLRLERQNPGFNTSRLISLRVNLPIFHRVPPEELRRMLLDVTRKVEGVPGIESAALVANAPFSKRNIVNGPGSQVFQIEGHPESRGQAGPTVDTTVVDAGYFETVRQPLLRGRSLTEHDTVGVLPVAVINEALARHRWPQEDPIGKRISFDGKLWLTIVGIAGNTREYGLDHETFDEVYIPLRQGFGFANTVVARTSANPNRMMPAVRAALHDLNPYIAVDLLDTVEHLEQDSMASPRLMTILLALFAGLAVLISASGIAAVMALAVRQRTHELGIRMALGARRQSIVGMVVKQGLTLAVVGTVLGAAGAVALARLLTTLLFDTSPTDAVTFSAVSLLFLAVAAGACFIPARQVTAIDPLEALRRE
jgi:putative ABC transport system permease protein